MGTHRAGRAVTGLVLASLLVYGAYACVGDEPVTSGPDGVDANASADGSIDGSSSADASCVGADLQSDPGHCGACGHACATSFECKAGACESGVAFLASGGDHVCAVLRRGDLYCWGANPSGQVGSGTASAIAAPTAIVRDKDQASITGLRSLGLGQEHSCALRPDGVALCWGQNRFGQLSTLGVGPDGGSVVEPTPRVVVMKPNFFPNTPELRYAKLAEGATGNHGCAVTVDAGISCWGRNTSRQAHPDASAGSPCGEQDGEGCMSRPAIVPLAAAKDVAVGDRNTCAIRNDGTVACWGSNLYGQLGNASRGAFCFNGGPECARPADVVGLPVGATHVAVGQATACALVAGDVWCWGNNTRDQLGFVHGLDAGDACCNIEPGCLGGQFCRTTGVKVPGVKDAIDVSVGDGHVCAVTTDGSAYCWGANDKGQLGTGDTAASPQPKKVADLPAAAGISVGSGHSCAWTRDGRAFCWGLNASGQIGSAGANASKPTLVVGLP